jgi:hypothetical protein
MFLGGVLPNINPVLLPMKSSKAIYPLYFNQGHNFTGAWEVTLCL